MTSGLGVLEYDAALDRIAAFERTLADDGAVILKFWMHLDRKAQKKQLESLSKDPLTRWRVTRTQWKRWKRYNRFATTTERLIQRTGFAHAPWTIVDGTDKRYRSLVVGTEVRRALTKAMEPGSRRSPVKARASTAARRRRPPPRPPPILSRASIAIARFSTRST